MAQMQPQPQVTQATQVAAFLGGINAATSLANMTPQEMVFCENMDISPEGLTVREGYREWIDGALPGVGGVKSILPYLAAQTGSASNKLFAATEQGIFDITVSGTAAPVTPDYAFATQGQRAGWVSFTNWTNDAGTQFGIMADLVNGIFYYDPDSDDFAVPTYTGDLISDLGSDGAKDIDFVVAWKGRLWLIAGESSLCYYTDLNQFQGNTTRFEWGNKFKYGGHLKGLYNWSLDGGEGMDDYLVAISEGGDVVVMQGIDPASADSWSTVGKYWIGRVPRGRRIATDYGGDLHLLSSLGLIPLSKLVSGAPSLSDIAITDAIQPLINAAMKESIDEFGWEVKFDPRSRSMMINAAKGGTLNLDVQFIYNTTLGAWTTWSVTDSNCFETYDNDLYMGREDGRVFVQDGYEDNLLLDDSEPAQPIVWGFLSAFQTFGMPAHYKKVELLRPQYIGNDATYNVEARFDYDTTPIPVPSGGTGGVVGGSLWDSALWDVGVWSGTPGASETIAGNYGIGRSIAIGMRGYSQSKISIIAVDMMLQTGGML